MITLKYSEIKSDIGNPQASRVENVNPYEVVVREGRITLNPSEDNWTRVVEIDGGTRTTLGDNTGRSTERIFSFRIIIYVIIDFLSKAIFDCILFASFIISLASNK